MSNDLISREEALKIVEAEFALRIGYDADIVLISAKKQLLKLPIAYDIDKVVEQLEKLPTYGISETSRGLLSREQVLKIVKGGLNENNNSNSDRRL